MDIREQAKEVIISKDGIAESADFVAAGIMEGFCRKIDTEMEDYSTVLRTIGVSPTKPNTIPAEIMDFTKQWTAGGCNWRKL